MIKLIEAHPYMAATAALFFIGSIVAFVDACRDVMKPIDHAD